MAFNTSPRWASLPVGKGSRPVLQSDTVDALVPLVSLKCFAAGTVSFVGADGAADTWDVLAGDVIPVAMTRVNDTGTTLTNAQMRGIV